MLSQHDAREIIGTTAYSAEGEKIGRVGQVFLDDSTGEPEFVTVNTGLFGTQESFVPVSEATASADRLTIPFTKDRVKDAPNVEVDGGHIDHEAERRLYEYYGLAYSGGDLSGTVGHDVSGPTTDNAMTRSEERLRVGTASEESERVRLRKYVVTEEETHTVPIRKERAVLEREPVTDANLGAATSGPEISDEEHELTLHEERPVVEKTVEPVERVRLGKEQTTQEQTLTEQVRKEQIEAEGDIEDRR